jgi:aminoglycoside phosphotransferase (APT) family kinase protein
MNSVLTFLEQHHQRLELARYGVTDADRGRLSALLLTPRFRASSHVVFLIFAPGRAEPLLVAKLPRLAELTDSLAREAANLQQIQRQRPGGFDSIPRLVTFEVHGDRPLLIETALQGQPLSPALVRTRPDYWGGLGTQWLIDLHRPASTPTTAANGLAGIEQEVCRFAHHFPWTAEERQPLERTLAWLAELRDLRLPAVFAHGDLSHPNLLWMAEDKLGVLDWEMATPQGLPASDLFFFLTYLAAAKHKARTPAELLAACRAAFFGSNAWAGLWVRSYAAALHLPPTSLTPLFVVGWLRYLAGLVDRLGASTQPISAETAGWLRENRYYALWRYAVRRADDLCWNESLSG